MHRRQLKKKASWPISPRIPDCTSTRSTSYLKTRVRGSRLQNAARILALVELSRRLHQAYEQAYDKQAADRLLPQNTGPRIPQGTDNKYIKAFNKALEELKKRLDKQKCADFFGGKEKALATINGAEYRFLPLGGPKVDRNTGEVSVVGAATNSATSVFINTQGPFLNQNMFVPGAGLKTLDFRSGLRGASFGALILLHELGHQLDIFGPDKDKPDLNRKYTQQVLDACFR